MIRVLSVAFATLALSGCSSLLATHYNRPVVEDDIRGHIATVSLAADRRTVIVLPVREDGKAPKFCAEPPPDAATAIKTGIEATLKRDDKANATAKENLETSIVKIADRTANLDAFRTGVYALCQFHLNGAMSSSDLKETFLALIKSYESVQQRASSSSPPAGN